MNRNCGSLILRQVWNGTCLFGKRTFNMSHDVNAGFLFKKYSQLKVPVGIWLSLCYKIIRFYKNASNLKFSFDPFVTNAPFLYPWKYQRKGALGTNGLSTNSLEQPMPNAVSLTCSSPHVSGKIQMEIFSISKYLVKSLINKNCPEPVMVLAWNLDHYLHFRKEIRWRQKNWQY